MVRKPTAFVLWIILSLFTAVAFGADKASNNSVPVRYSKAPAYVFKRVPRGSKSIFYGTWTNPKTKQPLSLHLYRLKRRIPKGWAGALLDYKVDVYELFRTTKLRLANTFSFSTDDEELVGIYIRQLWLDPVAKKSPIVQFDLIVDDFYGSSTTTVLVVCPKGIKNRPLYQYFGRWWNQTESGWTDINDSLSDANGYLLLKRYFSRAPHGETEPVETKLYWNGKQFAEKIEN
jgi:hypothetical protein